MRASGFFSLIRLFGLIGLGLQAAIGSSAYASHCVNDGLREIAPQSAVATPPPIARHSKITPVPEKVMDLDRLARAVRVIGPSDAASAKALADLEDGIHIYVVDSRGRLAIVNQVIAPPPGASTEVAKTFVGSHDGLKAYLDSLGGDPFELVAAGEIVRRDGKTIVLSNRSGSWRGGAEHLQYAKARLEAAGLATDPKMKLQDVSRGGYPDPHAMASTQVRLELKYRSDSELNAILEDARKTMRSVADRDKIFEELSEVYLRFESEGVQSQASYAMQFVVEWRKGQDSETFVIDRYLGMLGPERFRELLELIRKR